jgi:hypothetical protein
MIVGEQLSGVPVYNQRIPDERGPIALNIRYDLAGTDELIIDLASAVDRRIIDQVQTIYFNNTSTNVDVTLTIDATNQVLVLPGSSCGYIPVLVPQVPKLIMTGSGASGQIILLNVPMPAIIWAI